MGAGKRSRPEKGRVAGLLRKLVGKGNGGKNSRDADSISPKKHSSLTKKRETALSISDPGKRKTGTETLPPSGLRTPPVSGPKYFFHSDIPDEYNETYMRALPRDPEWIFVYWEISENRKNDLIRKMGRAEYESSKAVLRLIDVTGHDYNGSNPRQYVDMEIDRFATTWYIRVQEYGKTYILEYGFLTWSGKFLPAVRSNFVNVPRFGLSPAIDANWYSDRTDELTSLSSWGNGRTLGASEKRFGDIGRIAGEVGELLNLSAGSGSGMFGLKGNGIR